jgi:hypothetical protein
VENPRRLPIAWPSGFQVAVPEHRLAASVPCSRLYLTASHSPDIRTVYSIRAGGKPVSDHGK